MSENIIKRAVELLHARGSIPQFLCIAMAIIEVTVMNASENLLELRSNESTRAKSRAQGVAAPIKDSTHNTQKARLRAAHGS